MPASSPSKWLATSAALLLLFTPASAQTENATIVVNGTTVVATPSTIAPAVALVLDTPSDSGTSLFAAETLQLIGDIITNLTHIQLDNATLFAFDDITATDNTVDKRSGTCKVFPGNVAWPSTTAWWLFDLLLDGRLITTVPSAASCYNGWPQETSPTKGAYVTDEWINSTFHMKDPTSMMWPLYQGRTCMPTTDPTLSCTLGGYPSFAVNVSKVAHIQLAVNFARNYNIRLVVKNTGHDFNGKSGGAGALSIWTHHLKEITYIAKYSSSTYTGPAVKMGAGVQAFEIYAAAKKGGFTVVGGEGRTVGVAGGFLAGGGHSPLSSIYGMSADHVLAFEVVTPDGRFVTATEAVNSDLFWALSGGGGGTFGVVSSAVVKVYPIIPVTTMTFSFSTSSTVSSAAFWSRIRSYFDYFITYTDAGVYTYFSALPTRTDSYLFSMAPWFAPNMTVSQTEALVALWISRLSTLGITVTPVINHYDNLYDAWWAIIPKSNWDNATSLNATFNAIKFTVEDGSSLLASNIAAAPKSGYPSNAVNPAWRETCLHAILATIFDGNANDTTIAAASDNPTNNWMQQWCDVSPNAGAYMRCVFYVFTSSQGIAAPKNALGRRKLRKRNNTNTEVLNSKADISELKIQQAFYGTNYARLYAIKQKYDPRSVFFAQTAVGSEEWFITGQITGLPTQNGRLCQV